jgi:hypothetical protein
MAKKNYNPNGLVVYEGPSNFGGEPIVVIVTGLRGRRGVNNSKTGNLAQVWILRNEMAPNLARRTGQDSAICGTCIYRAGKGCYVNMKAPLSVYLSYTQATILLKTGKTKTYRPYRKGTPQEVGKILAEGSRKVRFGAYGDPGAVPFQVWKGIFEAAKATAEGLFDWTGYTHAWRTLPAEYKFLMASCDSIQDRIEAYLKGWRTFTVIAPGEGKKKKARGQIACPASKEQGYRKTCAECMACNGSKGPDDVRASVEIEGHGPWVSRLLEAQALA